MIHRFKEVVPGKVYRGSAPTSENVLWLKKHLGIKKIISLDEKTGNIISETCKKLGIKQEKIYLDWSRQSLLKLTKYNLKDLFLNGGPTYIHCLQGKDRTGLIVALFECKCLGVNPDEAIVQAKKLGFGKFVDPEVVKLYEKIIRSCKSVDVNGSDDIVSNEREYKSDNRDSYLEEAFQHSFSPYLSKTRQYPYDNVYQSYNDQSPTRENYNEYKDVPIEDKYDDAIPQVGVYNNDAGSSGFGPTINMTGFIYD